MRLHLIKMQPDMARLGRWAHGQRLLPARGEDDWGYTLHAVLAASFGSLAPKPFMLRIDPGRPAALLAYSGHSADALRDHAATFAEPDATTAIGLDDLAGKTMPERFATGHTLGFSIRIRPVVRTDRNGDRTAVQERDAFLAAVADTPSGSGPERSVVYVDWLAQHLHRGGAALARATLDNFRMSDTMRRGQGRTLRRWTGPDAMVSGVLQVAEPEAFAALLARGVGRHRAFGYGMLLLRPA